MGGVGVVDEGGRVGGVDGVGGNGQPSLTPESIKLHTYIRT